MSDPALEEIRNTPTQTLLELIIGALRHLERSKMDIELGQRDRTTDEYISMARRLLPSSDCGAKNQAVTDFARAVQSKLRKDFRDLMEVDDHAVGFQEGIIHSIAEIERLLTLRTGGSDG